MISKLWGRFRKKDEEVVTDLDALLCEDVTFRFGGKVYKIKSIALDDFLKFVTAKSGLESSLKTDGTISADDLAEKFHRVISSVCDDITIKDIKKMTQPQVGALYQLVVDVITGQVDDGSGKKKRKRLDIYQYAQASSSPNSAQPSDGRPK